MLPKRLNGSYRFAGCVLLFLAAQPALGGLYCAEVLLAELPSQWRGFLLDQRALRMATVKAGGGQRASPARWRFKDAAARLAKASHTRKLTADEQAELGALYIRLGEAASAVDVLRPAEREHPNHFHIAANLGTAWQLQGDLAQAAAALEQAVRLAPGKDQRGEELQLRLVRFRHRQGRESQVLDDLFGVRYVGESGRFEPGKLAAAERKKLSADAVALVQLLALWLPADGVLLWQLAELANASGDMATAAAILDGCVNEFGMHAPELRAHRQALRLAADALAAKPAPSIKPEHERHAGIMKARSTRPLISSIAPKELPAIRADGVTPLPWAVVDETTLGRKFHPLFPKFLEELNGKRVAIEGYMQPLGEDQELASFMLVQFPIGCWFCEMPEITGIVLVQAAENQSPAYTRGRIEVSGKLSLNRTDPENFLYIISGAKIKDAE